MTAVNIFGIKIKITCGCLSENKDNQLNNQNIQTIFNVTGMSLGINNGKIIIKSGDKILKEIVVNYEGCL